MNKLLVTVSISYFIIGFSSAQESLNSTTLADIQINSLRAETNCNIAEFSEATLPLDEKNTATEKNNSPSQSTILARDKDFYRVSKGPKGMFFIVQDFYASGEKRTEPFLVSDIEKAKQDNFDLLSYDQMAINGLLITWFNNGQVERKGVFDQGKRKGLWVTWYDNGQKRSSGHYKNGLKEGTWTVWYQSGNRMQKGYFQADRREGVWIYWYDINGKKKEAGRYNDDYRVERWNYWNDKGSLVKSEIKETDTEGNATL